jgi:TolA-binding protein
MSRRFVRTVRACALLIAAAAAVGPRAHAQAMDPDEERARQLIVRIRRSMREVDTLLLSGSQPDKVEKEIAANQKRIEELLKETESKSQSVIQGIEELIKLAKSKSQPSGGGGGGDGKPKPGDGDPQDGDPPQRGKSQDPQELQKQPKPDGGQPEGEKPDPKDGKDGKDPKSTKGGDPKSPKPDKGNPDQRDANRPPPNSPTGEFERKNTSGRWGMLPPKEAEDLQRRDAEEFPQRYRRWMELYFRRVNKLSPRDR